MSADTAPAANGRTRVVLPPRSTSSTRYHKPAFDGALTAACGNFRGDGAAVDLAVARHLGRRPCATCWPETKTGAGAPADEQEVVSRLQSVSESNTIDSRLSGYPDETDDDASRGVETR